MSFRRAIRAAYGVRRKTLRRALSIGLDVSTDRAGRILRRAEIDGRRRGETLDLAEFDQVARAIEAELGVERLTARTDTPPLG
jgi:16S rRNA (adenine1518-N6/adenine1519-N6)-dimethyltransferase